MGVIETGAIFNGFTFDGENSKDYGVYITGSGVFNAPERDVEMISIPGRDGAFAQDKGRFSNIEVTYPAGLFGVDRADFAQAISDFRNMLASRKGYCRLEDDYNPGEYRMAVFKAGVDVSPASLESGEFSITFDCKPQRWLTSGETVLTLLSGDSLSNPTEFASHPLLQVTGYGALTVSSQKMNVLQAQPYGMMDIYNGTGYYSQTQRFVGLKTASGRYSAGDTIYFDIDWTFLTERTSLGETAQGNVVSVSNESGSGTTAWSTPSLGATVNWQGTFTAGTSATITHSSDLDIRYNLGTWLHSNDTLTLTAYYNGSAGITFTFGMTYNGDQAAANSPEIKANKATVNSSYAPTQAIYIDLDIGEAYSKLGTDIISRNRDVVLPAQLPTVTPGTSTVTFDNTFTQVKMIPRWWKV